MTWDSSYLYIPAGAAAVFFLIGLGRSWKSVAGYLLSAYAALVISSQHNAAITNFASRQFGLNETGMNQAQQSGLVFAVMFGVLFLALRLSYGYAWRSSGQDHGQNAGGLSRLTRGLICGLVGWVLGAVVLVAFLAVIRVDLREIRVPADMAIQHRMVLGTARIAGVLAKFWIPGELPALLQ